MFHRTLYLHGFYIFNNLEKNIRLVDGRTKEVNGNHFVCDIVGLLYTAITLKSIKDARKWLSTAIKGIDGIIHDQICDDGVHYEFSPNYHRLVLEAILYAIDLMKAAGIDPGSDIIQKVALMLDFVRYYLKPDGEAPLIRDIDNGRFIVLGDASLTSHRHVLAMGRALINGIKFDDWMSYEDVLWLHSDKSYSKELWKIKEGIKGNESRAYISSGLYILRSRRIYTFIICSSNGMHGYCGHAHNDLLSYELTIDGTDFLTDSGSYLYTRWPEWRNRFRSTEYHNSAIIDDQETNDIPLGDLFMLGNAVMPKVTYWHSDSTSDMLEAEYTVDREGTQVNHKRYFKLYKKRDCLRVHDLFTGEGVHTVRIPLNFGVNIVISRLVQNTLLASKKGNGKKNALLLIAHANKDMNIEIKSGWLSKVYGRKDRRKVALLSFRGELPIEVDLNILYLQDARHLPHTRSNVKCEVAIREAIIKCHEKMKYNRLD
jgi:hypothetical protein